MFSVVVVSCALESLRMLVKQHLFYVKRKEEEDGVPNYVNHAAVNAWCCFMEWSSSPYSYS
jgi:hydroxymethylpyrimidine pyrophosphatase-like HAD family hydrolase